MSSEQPTYRVIVRPLPGIRDDKLHGLRAVLKALLRRYGYKVVSIGLEASDGEPQQHEQK